MFNSVVNDAHSLPNKQAKYLPALTGIRAIAAYMVFLHHFNPFIDFIDSPHTLGYYLYRVCGELHIGVTMFFVLSGLLISLRYQGTVQISKNWLTRYALNRFARIFPMYALITAITFLAFTIDPSYDLTNQYGAFSPSSKLIAAFLNLTFLKGFFTNLMFSGIAQGWSLTVEECFYFTVPFVLLTQSLNLLRLFLYTVACYLIGFALTNLGMHINFFGFFENLNFLFSYTFFGRCFEFSAGIVLARLLKSSYPFTFRHFTLVGIAGIILLVMCMTNTGGGHELSKDTAIGIILNNFFMPIAISSLFLGLLREQSLIRRILETRLFDLLGKSSYTFYLIHKGVIYIFLYKHITTNNFTLFVLMNALSIILFKVIEDPMHGYLKRLGTNTNGGDYLTALNGNLAKKIKESEARPVA